MTPRQLLARYDIGKIKKISRLSSGLIHASYKVGTTQGSLVLQKLHPMLGTKDFTESYLQVCHALKSYGLPSQKVLRDRKGIAHIPDGKSGWRLMTFVPGQVILKPPTLAHVRTFAQTLGKVHAALATLPSRYCSPLKMHQTKKILKDLHATLRRYKATALFQDVREQTKIIANTIPKLLLPADLPKRTIHGDPKISNFVLMEDGNATMIDLDTCGHHSPLMDVGEIFGGDAFVGSWCRTNTRPPRFNISCFQAGLEGYHNAAGTLLGRREQKYIVQAVKLIVIELAARFLIDYFNDSYFGWDNKKYPTRRAHNLARVNAQIAFYNDIVKKESTLKKIVRAVFSK